jgi:hypothetical protein
MTTTNETNETNMDDEDIQYRANARLEQHLNESSLFEERIKIIKELPVDDIRNEVDEIYLKYEQSNKLNENGDYIENSKLVDSEIIVEVRDGKINCYYFDRQFATGYGAKRELAPIDANTKPMTYSSLVYSGTLISDAPPTQVRSI